jgi:hypothetical protein
MDEIKVGFCVAYDWHLLTYALPFVYKEADVICLSIDKERISWSNNAFEFNDQRFTQLIKSIDVEGKVNILEDNFHLTNLTPMENEVRQRNMMASFLGKGGWHIQLDCDEYFINFYAFVNYLKNLRGSNLKPLNVNCIWITLFKQVEGGFLYIVPLYKRDIEHIPIATNYPYYQYGRRNGNFNIYTDFKIVHQSWARSDNEVLQKINNWGHKNDFDTISYYKFWEALSRNNYKSIKNFHPMRPASWPLLAYKRGENLMEFLAEANFDRRFSLSKLYLFFKNSRVFAKLRQIMGKL